MHNGLGATGMNTANTGGHHGARGIRDDIVERPVAMGVAEVPVVVTERVRCCCYLSSAAAFDTHVTSFFLQARGAVIHKCTHAKC